jgi:uncharacterized membrane protein YhdT
VSSTTDRRAGRAEIGARTLRTDLWWRPPLIQATVLIVLLGYVIVRLFLRRDYWVPEYNYLTPLYSPCISASCTEGSTHFGTIFGDLPVWIPLPIIVFPILLGFRGTCYYYRKAVYRSILQSPTACAVKEPARRYKGESRFPFNLMNYHRYFFYLADPGGERRAAVGLHAVVPRLPARSRRPPQALLAQPGPLRALDAPVVPERAAHAVRVGLAGERHAHRRLHHVRRGRMDLRPADRGVNQ